MMRAVKVLFIMACIFMVIGFIFPPMMVIALPLDIMGLLIVLIRRLLMPKEELEKIRAKNAEEAAEARKKYEESRAAQKRWKAIQEERKRLDNQPVAATLLYVKTETGKRVIGTAARALIGTITLGMLGGMIGIVAGRQISDVRMATFAVKYASGRKGNETVDVKSERFKELSAVLLD